MAQISSDTLAYQQIYSKLRSFFQKERTNSFSSNDERLQEYNKVLSDIYDNIAAPLLKYEPYVMGEPPRSAKYNGFSSALSNDIRNASVQSDYLLAKVINAFNMFSIEIETEKKYTERIASKAKILQMYNMAESEDIVYFGDSFENLDYVDVGKIKQGYMPLARDGQVTLSFSEGNRINFSNVYITEGNGFIGNNHQISSELTQDGTPYNRFIGPDLPSLSTVRSMDDDNPLTFFEYEALDVDKSFYGIENSPSPYEFSYIASASYSDRFTDGEIVDWSNFNTNDGPLTMTVRMESITSSLANCIEIAPYFRSMDLVKIKSIKIFGSDGLYTEILENPIYVGSSFDPLNVDIAKNYSYNKGIIKFSERIVSSVEITFEQENPKGIDIAHAYWVPNYPDGDESNSPFKSMRRFNPEAITNYSELPYYDKRAILPNISRPFDIKLNDVSSITLPVTVQKDPIEIKFRYIRFTEQANSLDFVFYNFDESWDRTEQNYPNRITYDLLGNIRDHIDGAKKYFPDQDPDVDIEYLKEFFRQNGTLVSGETDVYEVDLQIMFPYGQNIIEGSVFVIDINSIVDIESTLNIDLPPDRYDVPLTLDFDVLQAKRYAIGIRDISVYYEQYSSNMEIVSKPFLFPSNIETLMLDVDMDMEKEYADSFQIKYFISVENGKWIQISPIQLNFSAVPEVLSFNANIPQSQRLSGVSYFNYPDVPENVRQVTVKIEVVKNRNVNATPVIHSYKLIGKVNV